jgi:hypothetical protein
MATIIEKNNPDNENERKPEQLKIETKEADKEFYSPPCSLPEFGSDFDD